MQSADGNLAPLRCSTKCKAMSLNVQFHISLRLLEGQAKTLTQWQFIKRSKGESSLEK